MLRHTLLLFAPLVVMLCWAAAVDLRRRRIPNELVLALLATGLMQSFTEFATCSPLQSICGAFLAATLNLPLFYLGARGGGDVKVFAGAGAWLGVSLVVQVFLGAAILGMIIAIIQGAAQRRLGSVLRNTATSLVSLKHMRAVGAEHVAATNSALAAAGARLPYAVPILLATLSLLCFGRRGLL